MVARGGLSEDRRRRLLRHDGRRRNIGGVGIDLFTSGLVLQAFSRWNHALALSWVAHDNLCLNNIYRNGKRGAAPEIPARPVQRREDRRARPDRAGRRLRRARLDAHDRAARRRPLRAERQQDLHHQRRRSPTCCSSMPRPTRRKGRARHFGLHRREGFSGLQGRAEAREDGLSRQPDRRSWCSRTAACRPRTCVGEENRGVAVVMSGLDLERAMISPICLGISRARAGARDRLRQDAQAVRQADRPNSR